MIKKAEDSVKYIVSFGTCACFGGIPGLANLKSNEQILNTVYGDPAITKDDKVAIPLVDVPPLRTLLNPCLSVSKVPIITPRICGVCPVPHHLASLKAIENGLGVEPPEAVKLSRELILVAEHVSDHLLHMFVMAGSDIFLSVFPLSKEVWLLCTKGIPTQSKSCYQLGK